MRLQHGVVFVFLTLAAPTVHRASVGAPEELRDLLACDVADYF